MHPEKFGDSYDIVKRSLLDWLSTCGTWSVHPMFTGDVPDTFSKEFLQFLGVPLLTSSPVPNSPKRERYFQDSVKKCTSQHLLLDPDTGLALPDSKAGKQHLTTEELVRIADALASRLVLVFDMSFPHSSNEVRLQWTRKKLKMLNDKGVFGMAYYSHANFILVSSDQKVFENAKQTLLDVSQLPKSRFIQP